MCKPGRVAATILCHVNQVWHSHDPSAPEANWRRGCAKGIRNKSLKGFQLQHWAGTRYKLRTKWLLDTSILAKWLGGCWNQEAQKQSPARWRWTSCPPHFSMFASKYTLWIFIAFSIIWIGPVLQGLLFVSAFCLIFQLLGLACIVLHLGLGRSMWALPIQA